MYYSLKKLQLTMFYFIVGKMFDSWIIYAHPSFVLSKKKVKIKANFDIMLLRIECDRFFHFTTLSCNFVAAGISIVVAVGCSIFTLAIFFILIDL